VFYKQKWFCDLIIEGIVKKGVVVLRFEVCGRGRPRKVYGFAEEMRIPLRKTAGCEWIIQAELSLSPCYYI